ncbi:MAG: hypothetical protein PHI29_03105 [Gallionella sp.]|nr:hypothetical protein [Gallionella sp.]
MKNRTQMQPVSADANVSEANVKPRSGGGSQNRLHVQKALMEYLLLGKVAS